MFYVYMLLCNDNTLYTGYTNNIVERIKKHNSGKGAKYTKGRLPVELVYFKAFGSKSEALKREMEIKRLSKKEKLLLFRR